MLKNLVLLICIGIVIWFVTIGRLQVTEENVRALYAQAEAAFERADGKAYCELFTDGVSGKIIVRAPSAPISNSKALIDKRYVCTEVAGFYRSKEKMENMSRGVSIDVNRSYDIKSISIASDKKSATVEVLIDIRFVTYVGEMMILKIKQTDQIKISSGKIKFFQREAVGTYSAGAAGNPSYR
ncbi:hypothetical protein FACS1894185_3610 [Betaproteobacteria bacterium]|nr:hypothetical protein FACS1894185_3610 [Betaproteobacteria bacterium]GHU45259.1 hypothetical protein AGMMS50289_16020 [Betaproteobacteria bacterium]